MSTQDYSATPQATATLVDRTCWLQAFQRDLHLSQRSTAPLTVLLLEVDHLHQLDHQFGPNTTAETLVAVAGMLENVVRRGDLVTRYSDSQFAILCAHTPLPAALVLAKRIHANLNQYSLRLAEGREIKLTLSLGLAECTMASSDERTSFDAQSLSTVLLAEAESHLRRAQKRGGNHISCCLDTAASLPVPLADLPSVQNPRACW